MYLTTHASVGVLISQSVTQPQWIFLLSLLSHFFLDFIPHGDDNIDKWILKRPRNAIITAALDIGLLTLFLGTLYATRDLPDMGRIMAGVVGAILPDLISNIFPVIHRYTNWLTIVRLFHRLQYRLGLIPIWRGHDWFHRFSHNTAKHKLTVKQGIIFQSIIVIIVLIASLGYR